MLHLDKCGPEFNRKSQRSAAWTNDSALWLDDSNKCGKMCSIKKRRLCRGASWWERCFRVGPLRCIKADDSSGRLAEGWLKRLFILMSVVRPKTQDSLLWRNPVNIFFPADKYWRNQWPQAEPTTLKSDLFSTEIHCTAVVSRWSLQDVYRLILTGWMQRWADLCFSSDKKGCGQTGGRKSTPDNRRRQGYQCGALSHM